MSAGIDPLDRLATHSWVGDWDDVLLRAGEIADSPRSRRQIFTRRRVVLALAVLAVVLLPFVALAATHDWSPWWFFESGHVPEPVNGRAVVTEGEWNGHPWKLVAYASRGQGVCYGLIRPLGEGGNLACAPIVGVPRAPGVTGGQDLTITFGMSSGGLGFPDSILGPVVASAKQVEIAFPNGPVLHVETIDAPESVGHVRFYITPLPAGVLRNTIGEASRLRDMRITARDENGNVVACLVPHEPTPTPLSACEKS